jgi:hypothetical protein
MTMATMRPKAVRPIAMYMDCRYLGAKLLAKIDPMLFQVSGGQAKARADHSRSTSRVTDQLIQTYSGTSFEVALSVVTDPGDVQTGGDVKTHGNNEKGEVSTSDSRNSCE